MRTRISTLIAVALGFSVTLAAVADDKASKEKKVLKEKKVTVRVQIKKSKRSKTGDQQKYDAQTIVIVGKGAAEKPTAYIGIATERVSSVLADQLTDLVDKGQGLVIKHVLPKSPAEKAGLKPSDVLATYDDKRITSVAQLKKLVVAGKPGHKAQLGIIRAAKRQTIEVTLGQRSARPLAIRLAPRAAKRLIGVPGARIIIEGGKTRVIREPEDATKDQPRQKTRKELQIRSRSVVVEIQDGKRAKVDVRFTDKESKTRRYRLEGTLEEVRKKLKNLPESIREDVERNLDGNDAAKKKSKRAIQLRLQPQVDGQGRSIRIYIRRPGKDGEVRVFELNHTVSSDKAVFLNLDDLLDIEVFAHEFKQLSPKVREEIKGTLRRIEIPDVKVQVQTSQ